MGQVPRDSGKRLKTEIMGTIRMQGLTRKPTGHQHWRQLNGKRKKVHTSKKFCLLANCTWQSVDGTDRPSLIPITRGREEEMAKVNWGWEEEGVFHFEPHQPWWKIYFQAQLSWRYKRWPCADSSPHTSTAPSLLLIVIIRAVNHLLHITCSWYDTLIPQYDHKT